MSKEAMKLALEEMKIGNYNSAAERLETALAKQEQGEPVSTPPANCRQRLKADGKVYGRSNCQVCGSMAPKWKECDAALLTTPQQRKPLTDEQIYAIQTSASFTWKGFARAIEAAHGIKE